MITQGHAKAMRRSVLLWIGGGLVLGLNIFAASQQNASMIYVALAVTALFAIFGTCFGVWAARVVTREAMRTDQISRG